MDEYYPRGWIANGDLRPIGKGDRLVATVGIHPPDDLLWWCRGYSLTKRRAVGVERYAAFPPGLVLHYHRTTVVCSRYGDLSPRSGEGLHRRTVVLRPGVRLLTIRKLLV
jgi:hypothetical protein